MKRKERKRERRKRKRKKGKRKKKGIRCTYHETGREKIFPVFKTAGYTTAEQDHQPQFTIYFPQQMITRGLT